MSVALCNRMASISFKRTAFCTSPSIYSRCFTSISSSSTTNQQFPSTTTTTIINPHNHHHQSHQFSTKTKKAKASTTPPRTIIATGPNGTKYAIPIDAPLGPYRHARNAPKLAPSLTAQRTSTLRTMPGSLKNIRHSPWRLNLICQFAATHATVADTLLQLTYTEKVKAPMVKSLIAGVADNARVKYGLVPTQMEVVECFSTHGTPLKRVEFMGRGRVGRKQHRFSHIRLVLREIDFPLKIITAKTRGGRDDWVRRMGIAERDYRESRKEGEELERLEREVKEMQRVKEEEEEEKKK